MATGEKDMLKQTITGLSFVFLGLLLCVKGDEGFSDSHLSYDTLANFIAGFKERCPDHQDVLACLYWNSNDLQEIQSPNAFANKQTEETTRGYMTRGEEIAEDSPIEFPGNHFQKRLLVQRRKNPTARGYKRGPGFRSWGGKRDSTPSGQSLGSKRDEEYLPNDFPTSDSEEWKDKRTKFVSWGGKRNSPYSEPTTKRGSIWKERGFYLSEPFLKSVPKRPQFQSWGGKRGVYPWSKISGFADYQPSRYTIGGGEKRKFSSWGGKRYEKNGGGSMKHVFQNWGGKRQEKEEGDVYENTSGPKTPSNEGGGVKTGWEGDWDGKGKEGNMR